MSREASFRRATWALLFVAGFVTGLAFFFPREALWRHLIHKVDESIEPMHIIRYEIVRAGRLHAVIKNLEITRGETVFFVPALEVRLGLSPLIRAVVDTGQELTVSLHFRKKLSVQGELDLGKILPGPAMTGDLRLNGEVFFQEWDKPPSRGNFKLESRGSLKLNDSLTVKNLAVEAMLVENRLEIVEIRTREPLELTCSGQAVLDWGNLPRSTYQVRGHFILGDQKKTFEQGGRIAGLFP